MTRLPNRAKRVEAHDRLALEITDAVAEGRVIPCLGLDGPLFTSDETDDQARARSLCLVCPRAVRAACRVAGGLEVSGTYGGGTRVPTNTPRGRWLTEAETGEEAQAA